MIKIEANDESIPAIFPKYLRFESLDGFERLLCLLKILFPSDPAVKENIIPLQLMHIFARFPFHRAFIPFYYATVLMTQSR